MNLKILKLQFPSAPTLLVLATVKRLELAVPEVQVSTVQLR
jgi:hypothetical protein